MPRAPAIVVALAAMAAGQVLCAAAMPPNEWVKVHEGERSGPPGSVLVAVPQLNQMLLVCPSKNAPSVQAFDLAARAWSEFAPALKQTGALYPYYQAAYHPGTRTLYCLSGGPSLRAFRIEEKTWTVHPPAPELDAGAVPGGHSTGWMVDAARKLAYAFTFRGEAWARKANPATATLLEKPEE